MDENNNLKETGSKSKKISINPFWLIITILAAVILSSVVTALSLEAGSEKAVNVGTDTRSEFSKLYSVYDTVSNDFYDEVNNEELIESAIDGMVDGLDDPYSEYMNLEETESFQETVTGDFEGIGAEVMQEGSRIIITSPMRGSPAEAAGIEPGDQILEVDGESIEGMSTTEAVQLIRGEQGTDVVLTIVRGDNEPMDITVTRDTIHIDSVTYEEIEGVGHISINRFQEGTTDEFEESINQAADDGVEDVVLDFRYNPGGLLSEAVTLINQFVPRNEIALLLEDSNGEQTELRTENSHNENTEDMNVFILINEGSASASEVFTGAMDDHFDDIVIAGTTSFGKGVVQQTQQFNDDSMLKYTNTKWLTPEENWVHEEGITPDVELVNPDHYRVEMLNEEDVYTEGQVSDTVTSIKVALDTLGYGVDTINDEFDETLTSAVMEFQEDHDLEADGNVTGETSRLLMSDLRTHINENDAQLEYLVSYINGDYSAEEIEALAEDNAGNIDVPTLEELQEEASGEPDEE